MKLAKKLLAVVLALAMILGMTVTSSAAFEGETITYKEAVEVMTLAGVIEGDNYGKFNATDTLTRAQAAKIIVYMLGMEDVSTSYTANFGDIKGHWAEQYINIAAGLGIVAGVGNGKYDPEGTLTGYQWAKMLVTAMGYNAEYEGLLGAGWEANTAKLIRKLGMTDGITKFVGVANVPREEACQMAYNVLVQPFVEYAIKGTAYSVVTQLVAEQNSANGKIKKGDILDSFAIRLGFVEVENYAGDEWGRPGKKFFLDVDGDKTLDATEKYIVLTDEPVLTYTEAVNRCDLLVDLGVDTTVTTQDKGITFISGIRNGQYSASVKTQGYHNTGVNAATGKCFGVSSSDYVGAQGLLTEVYKTGTNEYKIVQVDTYLALVTNVTPAKTDANNHVTAAKTTLAVYDGTEGGKSVVLTDLSGYEKGDYILVQFRWTVKDKDDAAKYNVIGKAESTTDSIAQLSVNTTSTTLTAGTYNHAVQYKLGYGQVAYSKLNRTWFFDQYGNLIGSAPIYAATNYAVVKNIQKVAPVGAAAYIQATLVYMDGSENTVNLCGPTAENLALAYNVNYGYLNYADGTLKDSLGKSISDNLYKVTYNATYGKYELTLVGDPVEGPMTKGIANVYQTSVSPAAFIYTANSTSYLIRTGKGTAASPYAWTTNVSFQNVAYKNAKYVLVGFDEDDSVNAALFDADVAKYAYVSESEETAATTYNYVFFAKPAFAANLIAVGTDYYATLTGGVDMNGEAVTLTLKVTDGVKDKTQSEVNTYLTGYCLRVIDKLYLATIVNEVTTKLEQVTNLGKTVYIGDVSYTATYLGQYTTAQSIVADGTFDINTYKPSQLAAGRYNYLTASVYDAEQYVLVDKTAAKALPATYTGKYVYVIAPTLTPQIAKTFFLSDRAGDGSDAIVYCNVKVDGNGWLTQVVSGSSITLSRTNLQVAANASGSGVKIGDEYYEYGSEYTVNSNNVNIETGYYKVTLNNTGTAVAVKAGTLVSAGGIFNDNVQGDYVTTYGAITTANGISVGHEFELNSNINFNDGYYALYLLKGNLTAQRFASYKLVGYLTAGEKFTVKNVHDRTNGTVRAYTGGDSSTGVVLISRIGFGKYDVTADITMDVDNIYGDFTEAKGLFVYIRDIMNNTSYQVDLVTE